MGKILARVFPDLEVTGATHPLPALQSLLAKTLQFVLYGLVAYVFAGPMVLKMAGVEEPAAIASVRENKMVLIMGYFGLNMVVGQMSSTGAFELTLNGTTRLWSKLQTGRAPSVLEVAEGLIAAGVEPDLDAALSIGLPLGSPQHNSGLPTFDVAGLSAAGGGQEM
jgi:selT/selW/selH-like putative selenoprotein